jgi:hypothetical protein
MILSILILKRTGENLCNRTFGTTEWSETLTSGFISAVINFSQKTFGSEINELELGPYRLMFEFTEDIIIVAFFENTDSIINIRKKLRELKHIIYERYELAIKSNLLSHEDFPGLNEIIDKLITESSDFGITDELKKTYVEVLNKFRSNVEILDCDLITNSGIPLTKEWNKEFLDLCLRIIDAFWKSKQYVLDQIILSYEQRHLILHKINNNIVLSALVRKNTPIGLATFMVEETSNKIANLK